MLIISLTLWKILFRHHLYCVKWKLLSTGRCPHIIFRAITPFQMEYKWLVNIWLAFNALSRWFWSKAYTCLKSQVNGLSSVQPSQTTLPSFPDLKSLWHLCSISTAQFEYCPRNGLGFIHFMSSAMCQALKQLACKNYCSWWNGMRSHHCSESVSFKVSKNSSEWDLTLVTGQCFTVTYS